MADPLQGLSPALAGRYTLERELGRGGMATVYLATDLKHQRQVALKVLRPELAAVLGGERFLREITLTAGLHHPHILPLLDSGTFTAPLDPIAQSPNRLIAEHLFYTMPFVAGESLRDRLRREKQLPVEEALRITREVADALDYAHRQGIIHRDIKPENILLEGGHALVADFGIARAVSATDTQKLTETGLAIGTPGYMSPEQATATKEIDGRTDIYSLGCVLYEMLAGDPPYTGATPQAILARKLNEPLPRISIVRQAVPPALEAVIGKALARVPADRYQSAAEFLGALTPEALAAATATAEAAARSGAASTRQARSRRLRRAVVALGAVAGTLAIAAVGHQIWKQRRAPGLDPNVVAVMPLRVIGPDTTVRYLREGMLDIVYLKLQGGGGFRATDARTVLAQLDQLVGKSADPSPEQALALAKRLGAGRLLMGEVVADPRELLLNLRLLHVPDGRVVVEQQASRRPGEGELHALDRVLAAVLAGAEGDRPERLPELSDSLRAVQAYLAGMRSARREEYDSAYYHFTRALEIDTTFAIAALRRAQIARGTVSALAIKGAFDTAWTFRDRLGTRDRAILMSTLGPRFPSASTSVEFLGAAEEVLRLAPDDPQSWLDYGHWLMEVGYSRGEPGWIERATAAFDSAAAIEPGSSAWDFPLADDAGTSESQLFFALWVGDTARVRRALQGYLKATPTGDGVDGNRWIAAAALGDTATLQELRGRFDQLDGLSVFFIVGRSVLFTLPLDGVMELLLQRVARSRDPESRLWALSLSGDLALVQGRVAQAVADVDSPPSPPRPPDWYREGRRGIVQQALTDPGYEEAAAAAAKWLRSVAETAKRPDPLCWSTIWRVQHGDTLDARAAIERIRALTRGRDNIPGPRVGRFDMCPKLLEAMLEQAPAHPASYAALDRLDSLTRDVGGSWNALPINVAGFYIARWRERQGDLRAARAALARRPMMGNGPHLVIFPASFREEGRLAALMGDTAGAIEAYSKYLVLRTHPDPGPMAEEVRRVREQLAELVGEPRKGPGQ
jgi:hypothetical protein